MFLDEVGVSSTTVKFLEYFLDNFYLCEQDSPVPVPRYLGRVQLFDLCNLLQEPVKDPSKVRNVSDAPHRRNRVEHQTGIFPQDLIPNNCQGVLV